MIKINPSQKANSLIKYLTYSTYTYEEKMSTDYEVNDSISVLFLSLRFHCCKPEYIYKRINKHKPYRLSILLLLIDSDSYNNTLLEFIERIPLTIIVGFTDEECARYLRGLDINTNRSVNIIRRKDYDHETFLLSFKKLNKSNIYSLMKTYKTLREALEDVDGRMKYIEGIGEAKVNDIKKYYEMNFE
ncbi:Mating-type switching protein swi10 [Nosema bombycis CQ1]|uniref:Mating-type switching protein swi10 n=1 Tax=Nosema bombycis (strain CQ1 / CVCC 102059) TaxID=578461 RepID=R0KSZ9_NOSB1|nr:Mating-type switching protein swi10 [Nosema bombycis CQ1]|eukprot:EOB13352.1 Mating-type switching protein swi10 [Nosema bombycis CQ1]